MIKEELDEREVTKNNENLATVELYGISNVTQYKSEIGFKTLVEGVQDNMYVVPDFQRVYRWSETQVENLAVSLIRGMPIPPIYTFRNKKGQLEILDGQQRILSMFFYYIGKYTKRKRKNHINLQQFYDNEKRFQDVLEDVYDLEDKKYEMTYIELTSNGEQEKVVDISYNQLSQEVRRKLDYTPITVVEISVDDKKLKNRYLYKIFANLNAGGTQLNSQELRNGIYQCEFYGMLNEFNSSNDKWRAIYKSSEEDKYCKDFEWLLRFCALGSISHSKNNIIKIDDFKSLRKLLDDFSEKSLGFDDETIRAYKTKLERFVELLEGDVPKKITLLDALFLIIDNLNVDFKISKNMCDFIEESNKYKSMVQDGTGSKSGLEKRIKVVYSELQKYAKSN